MRSSTPRVWPIGNHLRQPDDHHLMGCDRIREALSARLDGEEPGIEASVVDRHLAACSSCTRWVDELAGLHRLVRVRAAEEVPDLSAAIVAGTRWPSIVRRRTEAPAPVSSARWALFAVALSQLVLAAPALLLGDGGGAAVHTARELGSFDVALAVGLLVAAWQPERAWGLLPVVGVLALVISGTAALDLLRGDATSLGEAHHLLELAGVALLWIVAREAGQAARSWRSPLPA